MRVQLDYGRSGLSVQIPPACNAQVLAYRHADPIQDPQAALDQMLDHPIGCNSLEELAQGCRTVCIAICDITRPVPNRLILKALLSRLEQCGIARDNILILVATGLHRPNDRDELIEMVGEEIVDHYRIENHDGQKQAEHTYLGDSPRGVPIWIDTRYVQADLKLSTGLIEPHLMAGFSGGRKVICPGLAGIDTIKVWHGPQFLSHPNADCGILDGNPVHEENSWIAKHVGCDFIVNAVIDAQRRPLHIVAGELQAAFDEGVDFVRNVVSASVTEPADIVVTSAAGYPLDTTFYQCVKGMTAAMPVVKEGGTIILAGSMSEGIGSPEFQKLFRTHATLEDFMGRLSDPDFFSIDQWQLQKMGQVCRKAEVQVVTDGLPAATIDQLFVRSASSVEAALESALNKHGATASVAVIPKGPYVLAGVTSH